eukprot:TRINITY_DN9806_c0_g1_i1.p1 TRINITY_DN9806_c0_g1~~TRINITY_DN9806_c0_g1_i1.p1  ORF type:complete len:138 (+),score=58.11 TRINITY_DN9806_c0_g1_i1:170-583(+)
MMMKRRTLTKEKTVSNSAEEVKEPVRRKRREGKKKRTSTSTPSIRIAQNEEETEEKDLLSQATLELERVKAEQTFNAKKKRLEMEIHFLRCQVQDNDKIIQDLKSELNSKNEEIDEKTGGFLSNEIISNWMLSLIHI